jgi:hypothetical protein
MGTIHNQKNYTYLERSFRVYDIFKVWRICIQTQNLKALVRDSE